MIRISQRVLWMQYSLPVHAFIILGSSKTIKLTESVLQIKISDWDYIFMSWIGQINPSLSPLATKSSHKPTKNPERRREMWTYLIHGTNVRSLIKYSNYFNIKINTKHHNLLIKFIYPSTNNSKYKITPSYSWQIYRKRNTMLVAINWYLLLYFPKSTVGLYLQQVEMILPSRTTTQLQIHKHKPCKFLLSWNFTILLSETI